MSVIFLSLGHKKEILYDRFWVLKQDEMAVISVVTGIYIHCIQYICINFNEVFRGSGKTSNSPIKILDLSDKMVIEILYKNKKMHKNM